MTDSIGCELGLNFPPFCHDFCNKWQKSRQNPHFFAKPTPPSKVIRKFLNKVSFFTLKSVRVLKVEPI